MPDWMIATLMCTATMGMMMATYFGLQMSITNLGLEQDLDHMLHMINVFMYGEMTCYEFGCMGVGERRRQMFYMLMTTGIWAVISLMYLRYAKEQYPFSGKNNNITEASNCMTNDEKLLQLQNRLQARKEYLVNELNDINEQIMKSSKGVEKL